MENGVDRMFRAFADRTRLRILHLLREGELCVGDLVEILRVPQAKTSRHLAYLRRSGLVRVREQGPWAFYSLTRPADRFHARLLDCLSACFGDLPELRTDRKQARCVRKGDGCCP